MAKVCHVCICVEDVEKSAKFYEEAFGLERVATLTPPGFTLVWMGRRNGHGELSSLVELRADASHVGPYEKGYANNHFAICVEDVAVSFPLHEKMGIIDFGTAAGPYFIHDPDGYSVEVMDRAVIDRLTR